MQSGLLSGKSGRIGGRVSPALAWNPTGDLIVTGALVVAIGVGWLGGASPSFIFAPTAAPVQQANSSGCAREPGKDTACDSVKTDREATPSAPVPAKLATSGTGTTRAREPSR
jgi:hypothetical protein